MNLIRRVTVALILIAATACTQSGPVADRHGSSGEGPDPTLKSRLLSGGRYDIGRGRTRPGRPFEIETLNVTIEVRNNTGGEITPECALSFGSQVVRIDTGDRSLVPGERVYLSGRAEFPRPLDDYESGDASCYTRLRRATVREMKRQQQALRMHTPTRVPDLVGRDLDSRLASFRRGLDIRIGRESTPCAPRRLMKMSRYVNPFGKPQCGGPVITGQRPQPGAKARVGDVIEVTLGASR